ncbi:arsenite methyltransferase [bacterium]|nr:arsenite methyltransferase [bacterium]
MPDNEQIRTHVADSYAKAVTRGTGCCCGDDATTRGVAAQWAGYSVGDTEGLPNDAVINSFGCGNPLAFSEVKEGQTVLDLGSGAGIDLLLAARKVGSSGQVIGIDMTDEMIAAANRNIAASGHRNVEVRKGLIEKLPVEDNSVDWVISNCVINLSPEKDRVFAEINRVLKPGGQMRVSDIVVDDLPDWVRTNEHLYNTCIAGAISEQDYLQGLRDAGLTDVRVAETLTYQPSQVKALFVSEVDGDCGCGCGCGSADAFDDPAVIDQAVQDLAGKVRSSIIVAKKG